MNIGPVLVGKVAAAVRSERLKHAEPSDAVLALAAIRAAFDWQLIETAPRDGTEILVVAEDSLWIASYDSRTEAWSDQGCVEFDADPTYWLPMIPLPEVV